MWQAIQAGYTHLFRLSIAGLVLSVLIASSVVSQPISEDAPTDKKPAHNESTVNERFQISAKELEAHWNLDCSEVIRQTVAWALVTNQSASLSETNWRGLHYCSLIYNSTNSNYYQACPDYLQALHLIDNPASKNKSVMQNQAITPYPDTDFHAIVTSLSNCHDKSMK